MNACHGKLELNKAMVEELMRRHEYLNRIEVPCGMKRVNYSGNHRNCESKAHMCVDCINTAWKNYVDEKEQRRAELAVCADEMVKLAQRMRALL